MYGVFNLNSNNLFTGIELPTLKGENNAKYYDSTHYAWTNSVMGGELVARPKSSGEFAFFSSKGSMIQIFSVNHESDMSVIYEKLYSLPTYEIVKHGNNTIGTKMLQDCRNGYNSIAVTHDKIYALYNGSSATTSNTMNLLANTILVYDWTGSPIEIIKLDHNFYSISIDSEKPEILYGLQSFDSVGIYKYNLKK